MLVITAAAARTASFASSRAASVSDLDDVISLFEQFMEEGNEADLELALTHVDNHQLRFTQIMENVQDFKASPELKVRTIMAIRKHFGLPLIPGAVCQRKY